MSGTLNGNGDSFTKSLLERFITASEAQIKEIQQLRITIENLVNEIEKRPCFENEIDDFVQDMAKRYSKQKNDCNNCQDKFKNKIISFMLYTLALLATGTAVAAGWVKIWPK